MVPIRPGGDSSATEAENCAESATMVTPHTKHSANKSTGSPPNRNPTSTAQLPLTDMAKMVIRVRPRRSARNPAPRLPMPPATPITAKVAVLAQNVASPSAMLRR